MRMDVASFALIHLHSTRAKSHPLLSLIKTGLDRWLYRVSCSFGIFLMASVESFADPSLVWEPSEPEHWSLTEAGKGLRVQPTAKRDFWSRTFYKPLLIKHDGQVLVCPVADSEATMSLAFTLHPRAQFDQAGAMVIVDELTWIKAGIEFCDGVPRLSCVVTNQGFSDWSTQQWPHWDGSSTSLRLRLHRELPGPEQGPAVVVEAAPWHPGDTAATPAEFAFVRIASFRSEDKPWKMGVFCFAPTEQKGCESTFHYFHIGSKMKTAHDSDPSAGA